MPLRDHFRSPLDDVHSWDELHGMWPATIVRALIEVLPEPYYAAPGVHLGTLFEVDVGTYREPRLPLRAKTGSGGENRVRTISQKRSDPVSNPKNVLTRFPIPTC
jgi:hypothetical protein